jgi:hypothetical protein
MGSGKSTASILLFAGSVLCFFLPFVTVSCGGQKLITLSGQQLATGSTIQEPMAFGPAKAQKTGVNPFASIAAICAIVGVGLSLAGTRHATATAVSGAVGTVSLGIMGARMGDQVQHATQGIGQANLEIGFTLTFLLLVAATAWNIYIVVQGKANGGASTNESV